MLSTSKMQEDHPTNFLSPFEKGDCSYLLLHMLFDPLRISCTFLARPRFGFETCKHMHFYIYIYIYQ